MRSEAGQSLTEVIIAATVGVFVVTALTFATIFSLRNASFAKNSSQATKLAQQGLEWVRTGRDRNECINNLASSVNSWDGDSSDTTCFGAGSIWTYQINGNCGNTTANPPTYCFFKVNSTGVLQYIGITSSLAEGIPQANPVFKRAVILSDYSTDQKKVTVIVTWSDVAGPHESRLSTILRRL